MFGNRGFFPGHLQKTARLEIAKRLQELGYGVLMMDEKLTKHGAVETAAEGRLFADFLRQNKGRYGGVILSLPNFGDELGAAEAFKDIDVPLFIQAYPDDMMKMGPADRRDAFCGKFALCDILYQYGIKYTLLAPHTVHPNSGQFAANLDFFDRVCRVCNGLKDLRVLALGARTTPFKSVRTDELALQRYRISVETQDFSAVIGRVQQLDDNAKAVKDKAQQLRSLLDFSKMPPASFSNLSRMAVVLDEMITEFEAGAVAIRCWIECQQQLNISPCILNGLFCDQGVPFACEVDICNAVMMAALQYAGGAAATILDWNNNYADHADKCIVFHCGNVPVSLLKEKAVVAEHAILAETAGKNCSWGCHNSRIKPMDVTYASLSTCMGGVKVYGGEGRITPDTIPGDFFGCAGVLEVPQLQDKLQYICQNGYRHHVSLCEGKVLAPLAHALEHYLGFEFKAL